MPPDPSDRSSLPSGRPVGNPAHMSARSKVIKLGPLPHFREATIASTAKSVLGKAMDSDANAMDSVKPQGPATSTSTSLSLFETSNPGKDLEVSSRNIKRSGSATTNVPKKRAKKDLWAADAVVQNPKSPLVMTDIKALLADPEAWAALSQAERAEITALMPDNGALVRNAESETSISSSFLRYDQDWSHSVSNYKDDLAQGRNDPEWQIQAIAASQQRSAGAFDQFKETEFEEFWGQKHKPPVGDLAGTTSKVKFAELFYTRVLQVGDSFRYSRQQTPTITLNKEAKIICIEHGACHCSFAPGLDAIWTDRPDNIVVRALQGPEQLCNAIARTLGFSEKRPGVDKWKSLRVFRGDEDLGLLFDLRQAFGFARCEGDYISALSAQSSRQRRISKTHTKRGYCWINRLYLVKKTLISDLDTIPQGHFLPIRYELAQALTNLAPPNYTFILCDARVTACGGICLPAGVSIHQIMAKGAEAFPTPWTRAIAGIHGPDWSGGHAHIDHKQLGPIPPGVMNAQSSVSEYERKCLEGLLNVAFTPNMPEAVVRIYNVRPSIVPNINAQCRIVVRVMNMMPKQQDRDTISGDFLEPQIPTSEYQDVLPEVSADEASGSGQQNDVLDPMSHTSDLEASNAHESHSHPDSDMDDGSDIENVDPRLRDHDSFYMESSYPDGLNYTIPRYLDDTPDTGLVASSEASQHGLGIIQGSSYSLNSDPAILPSESYSGVSIDAENPAESSTDLLRGRWGVSDGTSITLGYDIIYEYPGLNPEVPMQDYLNLEDAGDFEDPQSEVASATEMETSPFETIPEAI